MSAPAPSFDVLTLGHALVDVLASVDDQFLTTEDLPKGAMILTEDARARELYERIGPAQEVSGGSAANTAAGVVSCGGTAAFAGTVGNDQFGEVFTHDLRAGGVDFDTAAIDGQPTGRSLILVTPDGERTMNTVFGAAKALTPSLVPDLALQQAAVTYVEGYLSDSVMSADDWRSLAKTVHEAERLFSCTLSDTFVVERHRDQFLDLLDGTVDICFGNEDELTALYETDDIAACFDRLAKSCRVAAITGGAAGSTVISGDERIAVPAKPTKVIDTTGAGDLYAAGFLAGITRGRSLRECGELGNEAAAAIISRMGARLGRGERIALP